MSFSLLEMIFVVLITLFIYVLRFYYTYFTRPSPLPGPLPLPLFGNMLAYPGDISTWSNHLAKIYGDIYETYTGSQRSIWLCRGDLWEKMLSGSRNNNFLVRTPPNDGLDELGVSKGGLIFNRDLDNWRFYRKFMSRALMTPKFLKKACEWTQDVWGEMEEYWQNNDDPNFIDDNGKIVDLSEWALRMTTDSILFLTTHKKAYSLANYHKKLSPNSKLIEQIPKGVLESSETFVDAMRKFIDSLSFFMVTPWIIRQMPGVKKRVEELLRNRDWLNKELGRIVQDRREEIGRANNGNDEGGGNGEFENSKDRMTMKNEKNRVGDDDNSGDGEMRADLLTMFLTVNTKFDITKGIGNEVNCKPMTNDEIQQLMIEVFTGGIEATATGICYIVYHLEHCSKAKQRFLKELESVFGQDPDYRFKFEDLNKLEYGEAIIKEVLRICPATPIHFRTSIEPCEIGGYKFPGNTQFFLNMESVLSHPAHWTNPHEFNPDRFLDNPIDPKQQKQSVYFSFGGGMRVCPGKGLAMMQLKALMLMLYRKWEVELVDMKAPIKSHCTISRHCDVLDIRVRKRVDLRCSGFGMT